MNKRHQTTMRHRTVTSALACLSLLCVCAPVTRVDSQSPQLAAPGSETSTGSFATNGGQQAASSTSALPADPSSNTSSNGPSSTHTCVTNPTPSSCTDYKYSNEQATDDLKAICGSQPNLSACSLFKLCTTGVDPSSIGKTPRTCNDFHLLATACQHDSVGRNEPGCANYRSMCLTADTAVKQCRDFAGLKYITPTAAARQLSRLLCQVGSASPACSRCDWGAPQPNCNTLSVYGELCNDAGARSECGPYHKMCTGDPALFLCRSQLPGGRPSPPGSEHEGSGVGWGDGAPQHQQGLSGAGGVGPQSLMAILLCVGGALLAAAAA